MSAGVGYHPCFISIIPIDCRIINFSLYLFAYFFENMIILAAYSTNQPKDKCVLRVTCTSLKQKNAVIHAKVVGLSVFACANSSTAVRILGTMQLYM